MINVSSHNIICNKHHNWSISMQDDLSEVFVYLTYNNDKFFLMANAGIKSI